MQSKYITIKYTVIQISTIYNSVVYILVAILNDIYVIVYLRHTVANHSLIL